MILSTDIWVSALIRRAQLGGAFAAVIRKGDLRAGAVLVKLVNRRDAQFLLFAEASTGDGNRLWMQPIKGQDEADLDAYLARAIRIDPDLWVVEIDDHQGRHFLVEPVEPGH